MGNPAGCESFTIEVAAYEVAQNSAILQQTRNSMTLAAGSRVQIINRGGRKIGRIVSPDAAVNGTEVDCVWNNSHGGSEGTCFLAQNGPAGVIRKAHANQCSGSCVMSVLLPPPPPPNPSN